MKEYARKEGDTGSPEVQVAILTARIQHFISRLTPPIGLSTFIAIPIFRAYLIRLFHYTMPPLLFRVLLKILQSFSQCESRSEHEVYGSHTSCPFLST